MPIRAVLFDLFDTLVDLLMENIPYREFRGRRIPGTTFDLHAALCERAEVDFESFALAMGEVDREFRRSHYAQGIELPTSQRFEALLERLQIDDPGLPQILTGIHMGQIRDHVRIVEHHPRVLAGLREQSRVGICSNFSDARTAFKILEDCSLREQFDVIVISEEVGVRKPRPEIFQAALEALDVEPEQTLHVGDDLRADVGGAAALGIRTAWITRRIADPAEALDGYDGPRPDWQIADLSELPSLVSSANAAR